MNTIRTFSAARSFSMGSLRAAALVGAAATAIGLATVAASDTQLVFKSGQTWRGELNQQVEITYVERGSTLKIEGKLVRADTSVIVLEYVDNGRTQKKTIYFGDVKSMKNLDAGAAAAGSTTPAVEAPKSGDSGAAPTTDASKGDGAPATTDSASESKTEKGALPKNYQGVFYTILEGGVGEGMREEQITAMGQEADKYGPGQIIVFEIISPGGSMLEVVDIHKAMRDLRKRHRVVCWIREAISAAAITAMHCDEIYFMKEGTMGSATMWNPGTGQSVKGAPLMEYLKFAGEIASESGRDPQIARCMIKIEFELSYDIPPGGGPKDAVFRPDTKGEVVLDTAETMLTFNASQALACGVADGIADTFEELAQQLKIPEWKEVNDVGRKLHGDWQRLLKRGEEEIPELMALYGVQGQGDPVMALSSRIRTLEELIRWWDRCTECMQQRGAPPKDRLEREVRRMKEQLAEIKRQNRGNNNN